MKEEMQKEMQKEMGKLVTQLENTLDAINKSTVDKERLNQCLSSIVSDLAELNSRLERLESLHVEQLASLPAIKNSPINIEI